MCQLPVHRALCPLTMILVLAGPGGVPAAEAGAAGRPPAEGTDGAEAAAAPDPAPTPAGGAEHHAFGGPLALVEAGPVRRPRSTPKVETDSPAEPGSWRRLSFSTGSFEPEPGLDPALVRAAAARAAAGGESVYGFVLLDEIPGAETRAEIALPGVEVLGVHAGALKVRLPADVPALEALANLPAVAWVGLSRPEQKLAAALRAALLASAPGAEPAVVVNLFDADADGSFRARLEAAGAAPGRYDAELRAYWAVVPAAALDAVVDLDFVLFVEPDHAGAGHHNQSMATIGLDYIRPGAPGSVFDGAPIIGGIMDSGFMVGSAAPVTHQDLDRWGCGRNFTTDAAGVWHDEHGHGTHVLATMIGTGTAQARFRGAAPGVAGTALTRLRAAKVFNSAGQFPTSAWVTDAMDYLDDAADCGGESLRPEVVNFSGGTFDCTLIGTDVLSRKLDEKVWTFDQLYVVSAGNSGPGATTVCSPGVAKNALTVGNVHDFGYPTVGDLATSSSRGPTGDGRTKPNLVAPGHVVTSALAGTTAGYTTFTGTSMAAPHVAGVAATLMHHYPDFRSRPHLARAYLMAASLLHDDVATPSDNDPGGTRSDYGLGRVESYVAHWAHPNPDGWTGHWAWSTITGTQFGFRDVTVPAATDRLVVVLTWDEPAASAGAGQAVIDDIDLWVDRGADCTGGTYPGGCGEYNSLSVTDSVEYVVIEDPPAGTYRLKAAPWSVSAPRPVGIAAVVVRGDTTPATTLSAAASTTSPALGTPFTVATTVADPAWIASGVHLARTSFPSGVTLEDVATVREDGVAISFGAASELTLGDVHEGDTRRAVWTFRATTLGAKTLTFRSWSENGGERTASVTVHPVQLIFADGFESGNTSAWSSTVDP